MHALGKPVRLVQPDRPHLNKLKRSAGSAGSTDSAGSASSAGSAGSASSAGSAGSASSAGSQ